MSWVVCLIEQSTSDYCLYYNRTNIVNEMTLIFVKSNVSEKKFKIACRFRYHSFKYKFPLKSREHPTNYKGLFAWDTSDRYQSELLYLIS